MSTIMLPVGSCTGSPAPIAAKAATPPSSVGVPATDPAIARALSWLRAHQKSDGGWGEHWSSCVKEEYAEHPDSQAAMTAWAF